MGGSSEPLNIGELQGTPPKEYDDLLDKPHTGHAPEDLSWIHEPGEGSLWGQPERLIHTGHSGEDVVRPIFIMYQENGDERIYDNDYPKHKVTPSGNSRWYAGEKKREVSKLIPSQPQKRDKKFWIMPIKYQAENHMLHLGKGNHNGRKDICIS